MAQSMNKDLYNCLSQKTGVEPQVATSTVTGTGVDLKGFEGAVVSYLFGATGDTLSGSVYVTCALEESDDNSTYTTVAAADMQGTLAVVDANAEDSRLYTVGYIGEKRYIKPSFTLTGVHSNGIEVAAVVIRGNAHTVPTTQGS